MHYTEEKIIKPSDVYSAHLKPVVAALLDRYRIIAFRPVAPQEHWISSIDGHAMGPHIGPGGAPRFIVVPRQQQTIEDVWE